MSWKEFAFNLIPFQSFDMMQNGRQGREILNRIKLANPDVYWYPGSGCDLMPLVFDVPNNFTGEQLYPFKSISQKRPLILWMNDYSDNDLVFPTDEKIQKRYLGQEEPVKLLERLKAKITVESPAFNYNYMAIVGMQHFSPIFRSIPVTLLQVNIKNICGGSYQRPADGDTYIIVFSYAESELILNTVFVQFGIKIRVAALIRQGGWSLQRAHFRKDRFEQYKDIPRILLENEEIVGPVESYIVDHDTEIPGYQRTDHVIKDWGSGDAVLWKRETPQ
jgi:hypothetical protein